MATELNTLFTQQTDTPATDTDTKVVTTAIQIMQESKIALDDQLTDLNSIQDMINECFDLRKASKNRTMPAFKMIQGLFNLATQMKPLDVQLVTQNVSEERKRLVSQGLAVIGEKAGYDDLFNENYNGFYKQLTQGDFFALVGKAQNGLPEFKPTDITGLYFDTNATNLHGNGNGKCNKAVIVFKMGYDQAVAQMPWIAEKAIMGSLPSSTEWERYQELNEMDWEQDGLAQKREIEVGYYMDIGPNPRLTVFAGRTAAIGVDLKGDEYPHYFGEGETRKNYIPLLQWICFPTITGILNAGFGHVLYPIAQQWQRLTNKAINHVQDNMDPARIVNLPKQQAPKFLSRVKDAQKMKSKGQRPFIVNDFGGGEASGGLGAIETLQAGSMTADFERLSAVLRQELTAFGINLDIINIDPNQPLGSVEIQEENRTEVIRQVQEHNTGTYRMAIEILMDSVKKLDEVADKATLDMKLPVSPITAEDRELFEATGLPIPEFDYTVRDLKEDLLSAEWQVVVNSRSGAYPSFTLEKARLRSAIQDMAAAGEAQEVRKLLRKLHSLSGIELGIQTTQTTQPAQGAKQLQEAPPEAEPGAIESVAT